MRRIRQFFYLALCGLSLLPGPAAHAQFGGGGGGGRGGGGDEQSDEDAKRKKRDEEFATGGVSGPKLKNAGPCPYVKVLYDAARYVEFKDGKEASAAVGYTGEIQKIGSICIYKGVEPIRVRAQILFEFGRGPQAESAHKTYRYWVAVTDRNHAVLDKQMFSLPVSFPAGQDRVTVTDTVGGIVIPRADAKVSGANFEVLVGMDVTPAMAAFNRDGKRFRPTAGQGPQQAAANP